MSTLVALAIGCVIGYLAARRLARIGFRRDDVLTNVLDGLTLTQLNKLRDAANREIQKRIRQAEEETAA